MGGCLLAVDRGRARGLGHHHGRQAERPVEGGPRRVAQRHRWRYGFVDAGQRPPAALVLPHRGHRDVGAVLLWLARHRSLCVPAFLIAHGNPQLTHCAIQNIFRVFSAAGMRYEATKSLC